MNEKSSQYAKYAESFYEELKDENCRYFSWEHCYEVFHNAQKQKAQNKNELDYLSLHLAFYLASWGMYRGSSFLLQKDYRVHIDAVKIILKSEYKELFGIDCNKLKENENIGLLFSLHDELNKYYKEIRGSVKGDIKSDITDTLITKILMGTMGCVPAYDWYFKEAIKKDKIAAGTFNENSIKRLIEFYENHFEEFEKIRSKTKTKISKLPYPQMKILDMIFWKKGYEI